MASRSRAKRHEAECDPGAQLVDRAVVRQRMAHADIEGKVVVDLPDQPHEAGDCFGLAEFPFVENLCDRAHGPLRWPLNYRAGEKVSVMPAGQR